MKKIVNVLVFIFWFNITFADEIIEVGGMTFQVKKASQQFHIVPKKLILAFKLISPNYAVNSECSQYDEEVAKLKPNLEKYCIKNISTYNLSICKVYQDFLNHYRFEPIGNMNADLFRKYLITTYEISTTIQNEVILEFKVKHFNSAYQTFFNLNGYTIKSGEYMLNVNEESRTNFLNSLSNLIYPAYDINVNGNEISLNGRDLICDFLDKKISMKQKSKVQTEHLEDPEGIKGSDAYLFYTKLKDEVKLDNKNELLSAAHVGSKIALTNKSLFKTELSHSDFKKIILSSIDLISFEFQIYKNEKEFIFTNFPKLEIKSEFEVEYETNF